MANYDSDHAKVLAVQNAVNAAGYSPPLVTDGVYGPNTEAGVKWFQGQHGLTQDGIIGDLTMAATVAAPPPSAATSVQAATTLLPFTLGQMQAAGAALGAAVPAAAPAVAAASAFVPPRPIIKLTGLAGPIPSSAPPAAKVAAAPATALKKAGIPIWAIPAALVVAGGGIGFAIGKLVGAAIGAGAGLISGVVEAELTKPKATMHGEDLTPDNDMIIAGEIGMPTPRSMMKG